MLNNVRTKKVHPFLADLTRYVTGRTQKVKTKINHAKYGLAFFIAHKPSPTIYATEMTIHKLKSKLA